MVAEKSSTKKNLPLHKQSITELFKRADVLFNALNNPKEHTKQDLKRYKESLYNHFIPEIKKREISAGQQLYDQIDKEKSQAERLNKQINSDTILKNTQKLFELQNKIVDKMHEYEIKQFEYTSKSNNNKEYKIAKDELIQKQKKYKKKLKKTRKAASVGQDELDKIQNEIVQGFAGLLGDKKFLKSIKNILKQKSEKEGDYLVQFDKSGKPEIPTTVLRVANMLRKTESSTIKGLFFRDSAESTFNRNLKFGLMPAGSSIVRFSEIRLCLGGALWELPGSLCRLKVVLDCEVSEVRLRFFMYCSADPARERSSSLPRPVDRRYEGSTVIIDTPLDASASSDISCSPRFASTCRTSPTDIPSTLRKCFIASSLFKERSG